MEIITEPSVAAEICTAWRENKKKLALVPTMGFFHQGHLTLMNWAKKHSNKLAVSIFVNPAQFGPTEDLKNYPQDHQRDLAAAEKNGVDLVFAPRAEDIYPPDYCTWIKVGKPAEGLCGRSRPGHFTGVATIVAKLFNIIGPDMAVFGEKDRQQLAVIRAMAKDLNFPVTIVGRPIVREQDGLAMSSRNIYLGSEQRKQAPFIYQGLQEMKRQVNTGEKDAATLKKRLSEFYAAHIPEGKIDYIEFVNETDMQPVAKVESGSVIAVAVFLGQARLIDNIVIK